MTGPRNETHRLLFNRRREISDEIATLKERISGLEKEMAEIDKFTKMFGIMVTADAEESGSMGDEKSESMAVYRRSEKMTIKDAILKVLSNGDAWMSPAEIHDKIATEIGADIGRNSIGPQLQRLKLDGRILCEGRRYRLGTP